MEGVPRIIDTNIANILSKIVSKNFGSPLSSSPISIFADLTRAIISPRIKERIKAHTVTFAVIFRPSNRYL